MEKEEYVIGGAVLAILLLFAVMIAYGISPQEMKLTATDNGSEIELNRGQILVITLEANPSTGYTWEIAELGEVVEVDEQVLRQVGEIEFEPESELIGAGGVQIIRFETVNAGQATLKLVYHRPWETDVEPLRTFSIRVVSK